MRRLIGRKSVLKRCSPEFAALGDNLKVELQTRKGGISQ